MQLNWTFILIGVIIFVFLLQPILPMNELAFFPNQAFEKPWMFFTSVFLHADIAHIFFNLFALFIFGIMLEPLVRSKTFIALFFLAGFVGNFGYFLTAVNPSIPGLGASGAVYGLIGALAVTRPFSLVPFIWLPAAAVAIFYGISDWFGLFAPGNIAHGAHLGGLFIGALYGVYLRSKIHETNKRRHRIIYRYY